MINSAEWDRLNKDPEATLNNVCSHIANGGSMIDWCNANGVFWSDMQNWLSDVDKTDKYTLAIAAQREWAIQRILTELRSVAYPDLKQIFNDDQTLKHVKDWPLDAQRALGGIQVTETKDGDVKVTIKLVDKLKSIEMMMKNLKMLSDRLDIVHAVQVSRELVEDCSHLPVDKLTDVILGRISVKSAQSTRATED